MIPVYTVKIKKKLDINKLEMPLDIIKEEDGLVCNDSYINLRGVYSWSSFKKAYAEEKKIITYADKKSNSIIEFDEILENMYDSDEFETDELGGMELGIASLILALSAMNCAPISGCRAHPNKDYSAVPSVGLFAPKQKAKKLLKIAEKSNVGIINAKVEFHNGIEIYASSVKDILDYSRQLFLNK